VKKPATKAGTEAKASAQPKAPRTDSKRAIVTRLITRKNGATLAEIMTETGWQAHYADVGIMLTVSAASSLPLGKP
jgi:hypothetical protein